MKLFPLGSLLALLAFHGGRASCQTPPGFSPQTHKALSVSFGNVEVTPGKAILLADTAVSPSIWFPGCGTPQHTHLVIMVDLDAPAGAANRSLSPLLHWLQQSIPARLPAIPSNYTSSSAAVPIAPYGMPQPPPGSGPHRYVILAFDQQRTAFRVPSDFTQFNTTYRFNFDVARFVEEAALTVAGGTWFTTQNTTDV